MDLGGGDLRDILAGVDAVEDRCPLMSIDWRFPATPTAGLWSRGQ